MAEPRSPVSDDAVLERAAADIAGKVHRDLRPANRAPLRVRLPHPGPRRPGSLCVSCR